MISPFLSSRLIVMIRTSWRNRYVTWASQCLYSMATRLFAQQLLQAHNKDSKTAMLHWPYVRRIVRQPVVNGGFSLQSASNADNILRLWRHHVVKPRYTTSPKPTLENRSLFKLIIPCTHHYDHWPERTPKSKRQTSRWWYKRHYFPTARS